MSDRLDANAEIVLKISCRLHAGESVLILTYDGDPPADAIDEVGVPTTAIEANDAYHWKDGTHHHDCCHIALGNNVRRDTLVHGPRHMDGEVRKPTIRIDGKIIVERGVFDDGPIGRALGRPEHGRTLGRLPRRV
jgi:hypothetical protein